MTVYIFCLNLYELSDLMINESKNIIIESLEKRKRIFMGNYKEAMNSVHSQEKVLSFKCRYGTMCIYIN